MKQAQTAGHVIAAVLLTLLLQSVSGLPPVGVLVALVVPLPAAYLGMRSGLACCGLTVLTTSLVAFGLFGTIGALGYVLPFGLPSLLLVYLLRRGYSWDRAVAWSLTVLVVGGGIALYGLAVWQQSGVTELVEGYLRGEIQTALALTKDMNLSPDQAEQFQKAVRDAGDLLLQIYPAAAVVGYGLLLLCTLFGLGFLARSHYRIPGVPFDHWKVPELWIWGLILAGGGVWLSEGVLQLAARNLLVIMLALYFLQGLAIVRYFFRTRRVSPLLRTLGYVLLATLNPLPALVAGLGVFDLWIDFRKPRNTKD